MLDRSKAARRLLGFNKNDHIVGTLLLGYPAMKFRNKVVGKKMIIQWNAGAPEAVGRWPGTELQRLT